MATVARASTSSLASEGFGALSQHDSDSNQRLRFGHDESAHDLVRFRALAPDKASGNIDALGAPL
jgi:hypothetical protein